MEKLLVIGIDVGTILSGVAGVSYALLEPGKVPRIYPSTRFSGQREENVQSKLRSLVYYDQDRNVITAGPKTDLEVNPMLSEIEDVRRAECLKLRPKPTRLAADKRPQVEKIGPFPEPAEDEAVNNVPPYAEHVGEREVDECKGYEGERDGTKEENPSDIPTRKVIKPHPTNKRKISRLVTNDFKTPVRDFTDFLQYLFKSAKEYITETETKTDPTFTWSSIESNTHLVLSHPNEWEGRQHSQMHDAAVAAGLVNSSTAVHRIAFVTEGEAGLHFYLDKNSEQHQERGGLLVVDCGGGTIKISAYSQTEKGGFKEIISPDCSFQGPKAEQLAMSGFRQGSILVASRARDYFNERFEDSQFGSTDVIEVTTRVFDNPEGVKSMIHDPTSIPSFAKSGCLRDNDRKYGISGSKFKVEGTQQLEQIAGFVRMLHAHIEQASSLVADSLSYRELSINDVLNGLADYIGSSLCNDLRKKLNNLNMELHLLITQIALQSGLVNACSYIINNGSPPSDGTTLSRTYSDMMGVGRTDVDIWKTSQHNYITTSQSESLEINREYLSSIVLELITAVGGSLESEGALPQYNEVLQEIVEASLELRKVINEDMASVMEFVTYTIPCDTEFDPSRMEVTEGEGSESGSGRIICTMEAGLQCRKKERGFEQEWYVALKAKVVLASTLEAY